MNNVDSEKLRGVLELLLDSGNRINQAKPQKYWYPLSQATFGVDEILEAVDSMCSFRTSMWEKTLAFEQMFAQHVGAQHAVMVNSGSSADLLMCLALMSNDSIGRLRPGDEILIPAVTWPTQIWSAMMAGFKVRLVDVDSLCLNASAACYARAMTPATKAIFVVHLMGIAHDMGRIKELCAANRLALLEDCCEAQGTLYDNTHVGRFGCMGAFSFFFSHHMCTMEGGMIVTDSSHLADTLRTLRAHGWCRNLGHPPDLSGFDVDPRYAFINWGLNVRPTELQAGFGIHQLRKVDGWNRTRRELAAYFAQEVSTHPEINPHVLFPIWEMGRCNPSFFALPLIARSKERRNKIAQFLDASGIETRPIVAGNIARHPVGNRFDCFKEFIQRNPHSDADSIHDRGFYIGLSPMSTKHDIAKVLVQLHLACNVKS